MISMTKLLSFIRKYDLCFTAHFISANLDSIPLSYANRIGIQIAVVCRSIKALHENLDFIEILK